MMDDEIDSLLELEDECRAVNFDLTNKNVTGDDVNHDNVERMLPNHLLEIASSSINTEKQMLLSGTFADGNTDFVTDFSSIRNEVVSSAGSANDIQSPQPARVQLVDYVPKNLINVSTISRSKQLSSVRISEREFDSLPGNTLDITPPPSPSEKRAEDTIARILLVRAQSQRNIYLESVSTVSRSDLDPDGNQTVGTGRSVFKLPPVGKDWMSVVGLDGRRGYVTVKSMDYQERCHFGATDFSETQLLTDPFQQVMVDAEELQAARVIQKSTVDAMEYVEATNEISNNQHIWVDKYKPKHYHELMSDEGINRALLTWLKLWDECVFGRVRRKRQKDIAPPPPDTDSSVGGQVQKKKTFFDIDDLPTDLDQYKRPKHKIALLCGPPGLGKTTLAHVIARHAGYHVVEMNASDDRSVEKVSKVLETSTQMKRTLDRDQRPICLIIDEIDGSPQPTINFILNFIGVINADGVEKKRKKTILRRPLIAVCNDVYAPALRELRKVALILQFPQTESDKLAERLFSICQFEGFQTEKNALLGLAEKASNDIRSCINTLQFMQGQSNKFGMRDVSRFSVGLKDKHTGLFPIWQQIFQLQRVEKRSQSSLFKVDDAGSLVKMRLNNNSCNSGEARLWKILNLTYQCNDDKKLRSGLFENYLSAQFKDPGMNAVACGMDWFAYIDVLGEIVMKKQLFELLPYQNFLPVVFHMCFASATYTKLQYPNSVFESTQRQLRVRNVLSCLTSDCSVQMRMSLTENSLVLNVLPYVSNILKPVMRPVSVQLYSAKEKAELARMVDVMISFHLIYRQERSPEGKYDYVLEPSIDDVTNFPCKQENTVRVRCLSYATRQLIAREIELEKLRRFEVLSTQNRQTNHKKEIELNNVRKRTAAPIHLKDLKKMKSDAQIKAEKPVLDFFGRVVSKKAMADNSESYSKTVNKQSILYFKFNQGCNDAIRRNIRISDLI